MRSFTFFKRVTFMLYIFFLLAAMNGLAQITTFSSFSLGTVNYQGPGGTIVTGAGYTIPNPYGSLWTVSDEWGFTGPFDQAVKDDGTGNKVWRLSNAVTTGGFSNQPYSPSSPLPSGETTASLWNDRGPSHTGPFAGYPVARAAAATKYFHGGFRFKSATGASQPNLFISVNAAPRQGSVRMSYVGIRDVGTGFNLEFAETVAGGVFTPNITIASNLSYSAWHQIDFYVEFKDGLNGDGTGNDVVTVVLNGIVIHTGTTWETFYASPSWTATPDPIAVDAILFRSGGTAVPANAGNGLYFDDVVCNNAPLPPPPPVRVYADATATTLLSGHYTIQAGVNAAVSGNLVEVDPGSYSENVVINKSNLVLRSSAGKAVTTIVGSSAYGGYGSVQVPSGVNDVTIGQPGKGFKVIGFDGTGTIEAAAIYCIGNHYNVTIEDNEIEANGDHGLLSDQGAIFDKFIIRGNMFTGKTFLGASPGGCGFGSQFVAGNNVPRQLVTIGGGSSVTNSTNAYFLNNIITGTAGGFNSEPSCSLSGQGNNLVTIDFVGCTVSGNIFNGITTGSTNSSLSYSLRTRGPGTSIYCNTFFNGPPGFSSGHIFLRNATPLSGDASPNSLAGIASTNAFPNGGAYLTPDNASSYAIYRDLTQANTAAAFIGAGQTAVSAATALNCPVLNVNTGLTYATIQAAINSTFTLDGHTIQVGAGNYNEDVVISKSLKLQGAGCGLTVVSGPIGGGSATMQVSAAGVIIDGFTVTRDGNNPANWNGALNTAGIAIQGLTNNAEIRNCCITGNRNGIDVNNSNGNNIHDNFIDNNRTGLIFRNQTDNTNLQNNHITNNWTLGVLFLDASGGTNAPVQSAANSNFNNNNISGNWYGQVVDRQTGGSLPAPGANVKNFECNWYGAATTPSVSAANSTEPGYSALIPVIFGGAAVPPGGQPDLLGTASANIDYTPRLTSGVDANPGAVGFQPSVACVPCAALAITNVTGTDVVCVNDGTATVTSNAVAPTYLWMPGGQITQTAVGLNPGNYTVTVTDINGCSVISAPVVIGLNNPQDPDSPAVYTILAQDEVHMHKNTVNGNIGVWKPGKEARIHEATDVNGFVRAPVIDLTGGSSISNGQYTTAAPLPAGAFLYNMMPDAGLSDLNIPDNATVNIPGTAYKKITVGKNATATFTFSGTIFIKELITKDADNGNTTDVLFTGNTVLRIRKKMELGKRTNFNTASAFTVKVYVEEDNVIVKESSKVNASIDARFKDLLVDDGKELNPTVMTGQFIAKKVDAKKWVEWNSVCLTSPPAPRVGINSITRSNKPDPSEIDVFAATVFPNPAKGAFNIRVTGSQEGSITIRIMDLSGRVLVTSNTTAGRVISLGDNLVPGTYFAEIRQGENSNTLKLVKVN